MVSLDTGLPPVDRVAAFHLGGAGFKAERFAGDPFQGVYGQEAGGWIVTVEHTY